MNTHAADIPMNAKDATMPSAASNTIWLTLILIGVLALAGWDATHG